MPLKKLYVDHWSLIVIDANNRGWKPYLLYVTLAVDTTYLMVSCLYVTLAVVTLAPRTIYGWWWSCLWSWCHFVDNGAHAPGWWCSCICHAFDGAGWIPMESLMVLVMMVEPLLMIGLVDTHGDGCLIMALEPWCLLSDDCSHDGHMVDDLVGVPNDRWLWWSFDGDCTWWWFVVWSSDGGC